MDSPSNGGRDSRFTLGSYEMPEMQILSSDGSPEMYATAGGILHNRPTSITSSLCRSSVSSSNSCSSGGLQRGLKRGSADICYEAGLSSRSQMLGAATECNASDIIEDKYSPSHHHPKNSPLSNGKKTKGRVKIKMEYIDNKLRRYTTFSKRKTGIMKKAYELSTLTGTQVMLLVASETGHVYTFATRKLQPMITSDAGKALIQTCLNSPDPCPSGSGDQRMSATGFEETELSYNIGDDEKVDSSSCSPYRSDSSDSSDVESVSGSPSSPPPLISLQDFQSSSAATATASAPATAATASAAAVTRTESRGRGISGTNQSVKKSSPCLTNQVKIEVDDECNGNLSSTAGGIVKNSVSMDSSGNSGGLGFAIPPTASQNVSNVNVSELLSKHTTPNGIVFTLEQLQREFGIHTTPSASGLQQFITIPLLGGGIPATGNTSDPPAAHQTPADLSNRSRK